MPIRNKWVGAAMLAASMAMSGTSVAQAAYPSHPITIICPFPAGGGTDIIARVVASELSKTTGQSVIVENRPGANGTIGSMFVSKAAPDGYTVLLGTVGTHGINQAAYDNVPYDAVKDFTPITMVGRTPMLVLANQGVKANTIPELIEQAKASQHPMVYSSAGVGSVGHMAGELFAKVANVELTHSPYKGAAPAVMDLVGGQLPLMFGTPVSTLSFVESKKIKVLGVTSAQRSKLVPDVKTLDEQGLKGFDVSTWYGFLAPAHTPKPVADYLAGKIKLILETPEVQKKFLQEGVETVGNTPDEFKAQISAEVQKWGKVLSKSKAPQS
jgi:tripartite-type tricarboxylate transporter receptor subunit TctC